MSRSEVHESPELLLVPESLHTCDDAAVVSYFRLASLPGTGVRLRSLSQTLGHLLYNTLRNYEAI